MIGPIGTLLLSTNRIAVPQGGMRLISVSMNSRFVEVICSRSILEPADPLDTSSEYAHVESKSGPHADVNSPFATSIAFKSFNPASVNQCL